MKTKKKRLIIKRDIVILLMRPIQKNRPYDQLKNKWTDLHVHVKKSLWDKHKDALDWVTANFSPKQLAIGSLSGLLVATSPFASDFSLDKFFHLDGSPVIQSMNKEGSLKDELLLVVPKDVRELDAQEETQISEILTKNLGIKVVPEVDGMRLNRTYGYIGQEQHLARFPGDSMEGHFETQEQAEKFGRHGMAPGLGAWGYIGDTQREKYYIAVQTFLAKDFMNRFAEYRDFFKYRKMLVVNAENGKAVVVVIGDAGPAVWTGKHLGGSPEVMNHLERVDGAQKGPVLYFFIDDPEDNIPLGPIEL